MSHEHIPKQLLPTAHIDNELISLSATWKAAELAAINDGEHLVGQIKKTHPPASEIKDNEVMDEDWPDIGF